MRGVLRAVSVTVVGAGLVLGAANAPGSVDWSAPTAAANRPTSDAGSAGSTGSTGSPEGTGQPNGDSGSEPSTGPPAAAQPVAGSNIICPGPEAQGVTGVTTPAPAQRVSVLAVTPPRSALPPAAVATGPGSILLNGLPASGRITGGLAHGDPDRGRLLSLSVGGAESVEVTGAGSLAPGAAAVQRSLVPSGDQRALVTSPCGPAAADSWLVAGGAQPGRRARVVLANSGANPVTVDLTVLGAKGPVQSPNGLGIVVPARGRVVQLLDAISGGEPSPVVHVSVHGGEVAASINDTWLDGVVPRGGDDAPPVAGPAKEQVIPGVRVDGAATLRIAVPGGAQAVVQTRVLTSSGPRAIPRDAVVRIPGQSSRDIDLSALPADVYAVQVRSDVPVVAGAVIERRGAAAGTSDLAWSAASAPITGLAGLPLQAPRTSNLSARLDLAAVGKAAAVTVTTTDAAGRATAIGVQVPADGVKVVSLGAATSVWVTPHDGAPHAAVVTWAADRSGVLLSVTPLSDLALTAVPVRVTQLPD